MRILYRTKLPTLMSLLHGLASVMDGLVLLFSLGQMGSSLASEVIVWSVKRRIRFLRNQEEK